MEGEFPAKSEGGFCHEEEAVFRGADRRDFKAGSRRVQVPPGLFWQPEAEFLLLLDSSPNLGIRRSKGRDADHLEGTLVKYFRDYHRSRPHLALGKQCPVLASDHENGVIFEIPEPGGLHHRYQWIVVLS